jgi:hypothetical protein
LIDEGTLQKPCWWRLRRFVERGYCHEIEAERGVRRRECGSYCRNRPADPQLFIGLQQAGVNGGAITIYTGPPTAYGTFFQSNNSGFVTAAFATIPPLVGDTIDVCCNSPGTPGGTLVVWMTATGNLASNVPIPQMFESSFTENLLPDGWTVQVIPSSIRQTASSLPPFRCRATYSPPPTRPSTRSSYAAGMDAILRCTPTKPTPV